MKKVCAFIIVFVLAFVGFKQTNSNNDNNLRVRVIANSDEIIDIQIKLECVEVIKDIITPNDTKEILLKKNNSIKEALKQIENKYNVNITTGFEKMEYEAKMLDGKVIPSGIYETYCVKIGKSMGSNYWTILYPDYFGISFEDIKSGELVYDFYLRKLFS